MDQQQAKFEGWAVVGLFGHQKEGGFVTTEYYGNAAMFRIDVPELPEREWVLERPQRGDNYELLPIGTKVKREAVPCRSRLVGPGAVYDMTPCTEEVAKLAIERGLARPLIVLEMPEKKLLSATGVHEPFDVYEVEGEFYFNTSSGQKYGPYNTQAGAVSASDEISEDEQMPI